MTRRLTCLPIIALLAACAGDPPAPAVAPRPEEAFRAGCQQRLPNASTFGIEKCMADDYDRSRGVTPASATPNPPPAPAPSTSRAPARRGR